ncbi:MAG: hypothetical protein MUE72_07995 [Chitinophagaceae bacterium]|jgi:hypothetical protein|nr:hypothetical protein [Chitinophagaceae bacterium]
MIRLLTFIFLIIIKSAIAQNDILYNKWIAVSSQPLGNNSEIPIEGVAFDIRKDSLVISTLLSDSVKVFSLKRKNKKLKFGKKYFAKIDFLSNDSLILHMQNKVRIKFVAINDLPEIESFNLTDNSWTLKWYEGDLRRIDFLNESYLSGNVLKAAITHFKSTKHKYQNKEMWALRNIHGQWFLLLTETVTNPIIFQVAAFNEDSLKLIRLDSHIENNFILYKNKIKEDIELDVISNYLTKKKWQTSEILHYSSSFTESEFEKDKYLGFYSWDTTLISKQDLLNKKMAFHFKPDFKLCVYNGEKEYFKTNWKLSNDGFYVIINDGRRPNDFIEIISIDKNQLVLGKADHFGIGNKREFIELYYEIRLE